MGRRCRRLRFVDAHPGTVYRYDPADGSLTSCTVGQPVGAVVVREAGGVVAAARDGIGLLDERTGGLDLIAPIELDVPGSRMNDAKCDPAGRLWAGTMALDLTAGAGSLYRILRDHSFTRVVDGDHVLQRSRVEPRGRSHVLHRHVRARRRRLRLRARNRRRLEPPKARELSLEDGLADGLAVDSEGHLWVVLFGGGCVRRYAPDGRLVDRLELPVSQPTSVAFGGDDLGDLYITTATYQLAAEQLAEQPYAGATFVCRPGVTGTPVHAFGG